MNKKYLEYINDKLVLREPVQIEYVKLLSQINDLLDTKTQMISVKNRILRLTRNGRGINFYIDYLKCSGVCELNNKRLQIPVNKKSDDKKGFPIGIYYSDDKSCYVLFDNEDLSKNNSYSNRSIWVDFTYLFVALKNKKNLKYECLQKNNKTKYWIYISTDINSILDRNFDTFKELDDKAMEEAKSEIYEFLKRNYVKEKSDEGITDFIFKKDTKTGIETESQNAKYHSIDKEVGRIGEELFNVLLKTNNRLVLSELKLKKIKEFTWNNEHEESFLPFDFLINNKVYVDIKATTSKLNYFVLSDTEYKFKQTKDESGQAYYVANLTNVSDSNNMKWHFFNSKDIDGINCIEKTERIYGQKYEK